ncbi:MAG: hypothetical protein JWM80_5889 [Cyanobacteria bacterium RYN_339]|nr:hypothetical protein [Cyanobacteria bacterium RYN_339]
MAANAVPGFGGQVGAWMDQFGIRLGGIGMDTQGDSVQGGVQVGQQGLEAHGVAVGPGGGLKADAVFGQDGLQLSFQSPFLNIQGALPIPQFAPPQQQQPGFVIPGFLQIGRARV